MTRLRGRRVPHNDENGTFLNEWTTGNAFSDIHLFHITSVDQQGNFYVAQSNHTPSEPRQLRAATSAAVGSSCARIGSQ